MNAKLNGAMKDLIKCADWITDAREKGLLKLAISGWIDKWVGISEAHVFVEEQDDLTEEFFDAIDETFDEMFESELRTMAHMEEKYLPIDMQGMPLSGRVAKLSFAYLKCGDLPDDYLG